MLKNGKIFKVLYNMGADGPVDKDSDVLRSGVRELPFVEKRMNAGEYFVTKSDGKYNAES